MFETWQLTTISLTYIGLLFGIAYVGDKYRHQLVKRGQPFIYAMTLGVYCTSWSFLGTTGQASTNFFSHLPIYLGPILIFLFTWPFLQRIIRVSLKLNLTSIADLLAARYGKSQNLAIIVTIVALIGTMPYLALQLKGIVYSFEQLQGQAILTSWQLGLIVSLVLAGFTVLFGIRHLDVTERHPGIMLAIAFESLIKLSAFFAVGVFVCYFLFDSPVALWQETQAELNLSQQLNLPNFASFAAMLVIVMAAFLSLPRQFQVMVVELQSEADTKLSRKLFPLYLLIFAVLAIPLGLAGHTLLANQVPSDTYVLFLPALGEQKWLTLFAFLGAVSAASSMVIISAIALSTMLSNEIVFPIIYRFKKNETVEFNQFRVNLLRIRKLLVFVVILLGYLVFFFASPDTLSSLGEIAFGAFAQLTPALIAAFYSRRVNLAGVYTGILVGFSLWLFLSFIPQLGFYLQPFSPVLLPSNTIIALLCLTANILVMYLISQISRQTVQERVQASIFLEWKTPSLTGIYKKKTIEHKELELLVSRFVGVKKAKQSFQTFMLTAKETRNSKAHLNELLLEHTENTLASVMGASSARLVLSSAFDGRDFALDELAVLVEEASSQRQRFSQSLLQSAIENASEGISIIDKDLKLVAWNKKYLDLFNYPDDLIYLGSPIADLIQYNVKRGLCGEGDISAQVKRRVDFLRNGYAHQSERELDDKFIHIEGNPLPDGGFVMLFSDITAYRHTERSLKAENTDLEALVNERTKKLETANKELDKARKKADEAHVKKSLYLKTCSHDLMQPLEAARLFTEALAQGTLTAKQSRQVDNIGHSLKIANDLLSDLTEIARIDSGNVTPQLMPISLDKLFESLASEFSAMAAKNQITFKIVKTKSWVYSDLQLLRRILQNLLGNAFRYASPGKVLLGIRRNQGNVIIQIIDNGPGIPKDKQALIFEQFTQLCEPQSLSSKGLGLGLNITRSLSQLLGHPLRLTSQMGCGSTFSVSIPKAIAAGQSMPKSLKKMTTLKGATVLCIDDDEDVLSAMVEVLTSWKCEVLAADTAESAHELFNYHKYTIDIVLADYQISAQTNGIELVQALRASCSFYLPAILITANTEDDIESRAKTNDMGYMKKVVKPAALRAMISAQLSKKLQSKYGTEL